MKKQLYKWHRILGIIVCIPLIFWALSGITHPLMNWVQPDIATNQPYSNQISGQDLMPLHEVLDKGGIGEFERVRLIKFENTMAYQVRLPDDPVLKYWDANSGETIPDGDEIYARYLARYFLGDQESTISDIELVESFTTQYRSINRLLPAYKVTFDRPDNMKIYVETASSRLGTSVDRFRSVNQSIFWLFHNFGFLNFTGWFLPVFLILLSAAALISAIFGIAVFGFTKANGNSAIRKSHRYTGIGVSLALILFTASAVLHTFGSLTNPDNRHLYKDTTSIKAVDFPITIADALLLADEPQEWTVVSLDGEIYHRVQGADRSVLYVNTKTGNVLEYGDILYATELANRFGTPGTPVEATVQGHFGGEYGFINKRLPVIKLTYDDSANQSFYIETWTGHLAAQFTQSSRFYGLTFTIFHKWHFLDALGRDVRDAIMVLFCLLIALTAASGLWIYAKKTNWSRFSE